jgi:hypothetical protein
VLAGGAFRRGLQAHLAVARLASATDLDPRVAAGCGPGQESSITARSTNDGPPVRRPHVGSGFCFESATP